MTYDQFEVLASNNGYACNTEEWTLDLSDSEDFLCSFFFVRSEQKEVEVDARDFLDKGNILSTTYKDILRSALCALEPNVQNGHWSREIFDSKHSDFLMVNFVGTEQQWLDVVKACNRYQLNNVFEKFYNFKFAYDQGVNNNFYQAHYKQLLDDARRELDSNQQLPLGELFISKVCDWVTSRQKEWELQGGESSIDGNELSKIYNIDTGNFPEKKEHLAFLKYCSDITT